MLAIIVGTNGNECPLPTERNRKYVPLTNYTTDVKGDEDHKPKKGMMV